MGVELSAVLAVLAAPRTWILVGLALDLIGAVVVLWGVAGLTDPAIQRHERPLTADMTKIGTEEVELLRNQRRKARIGAGILAFGFLLQLLGQARAATPTTGGTTTMVFPDPRPSAVEEARFRVRELTGDE